jgi:protein-S-isoprenylcysteine O-methyltransferase Ste14
MDSPYPSASKDTETRAYKIGGIFQMSMMLFFIIRSHLTFTAEIIHLPPLPVRLLSHFGFLPFLYCLYLLYFRRKKLTKLVTTGLFRFTRHPMYSGIALMDILHWFMYRPWYISSVTALAFYVALLGAAY